MSSPDQSVTWGDVARPALFMVWLGSVLFGIPVVAAYLGLPLGAIVVASSLGFVLPIAVLVARSTTKQTEPPSEQSRTITRAVIGWAVVLFLVSLVFLATGSFYVFLTFLLTAILFMCAGVARKRTQGSPQTRSGSRAQGGPTTGNRPHLPSG